MACAWIEGWVKLIRKCLGLYKRCHSREKMFSGTEDDCAVLNVVCGDKSRCLDNVKAINLKPWIPQFRLVSSLFTFRWLTTP